MTKKPLFDKDYGLSNQIQRAAISTASNIAEGSAAEVITQLHITYKIDYIDEETFTKAEDFTEKIRATIKKNIINKKSRLWQTLHLTRKTKNERR